MAYSAKVLKDSVAPSGVRLTTLEVSFPRIVLAEFNTHRMFSRNSASSRAIPVEKMLERVRTDPFVPVYWGKNQKGMQANQELQLHEQEEALARWMLARDRAIEGAVSLLEAGIHKQITNRLLEPFLWHTVIVSATDWTNFFNLRCHPDAQPEIRIIAEMMRDTLATSTPEQKYVGEWHLPLIGDDEGDIWSCSIETVKKISVGRCARVSYLTHDGKREPQADIDLAEKLQQSGHMSPCEHAAEAISEDVYYGNFRGWKQYRKHLPNEAVFPAL
jgi:hypothetical protein